MKERDIYLNQK